MPGWEFEIEKSEWHGIVAIAAIGVIWMLFLIPYLGSQKWFLEMNPIPAYFVYNLGFIALHVGVLGGGIDYAFLKRQRLSDALKIGLTSFLSVSFIVDLLEAPYYLSPSGQVLIPLGTITMESTAVDAFSATAWRMALGNIVDTQIQVLGTTFSLWYVLTYYVTILLVVLLLAVLLEGKKFRRMWREAF